MSWLADAKHDQRPKRGAWAPGEYLHRACSECGSPFCGDKRAMECADCAYGKPSPVALNERDTLAQVLIRIRKHTGMAQKTLAEKLGVTPQYICDLEKSRRLGSVEIVEALVDHFGNGPRWRKVLHAIAARGHGWDV